MRILKGETVRILKKKNITCIFGGVVDVKVIFSRLTTDTVQSSLLPGKVHVRTLRMDSSNEQQRRPGVTRKKVVVCLCVAVVIGVAGGVLYINNKPVSDEGTNKTVTDAESVTGYHHRMERTTKPNEERARQEDHNQSATTPSQEILDDRRYELDRRLKQICKQPQDQYIKVDGTTDQYVSVQRCACKACGDGYTCQPTSKRNTTVVIRDDDDDSLKEVYIEEHTACECNKSQTSKDIYIYSLEDRHHEQRVTLKGLCAPQKQYIDVHDKGKNYAPVSRCACKACGGHSTCEAISKRNTTVVIVNDDNSHEEVDIEEHTECACK